MIELNIASDAFVRNPYPFYAAVREARVGWVQPYGVYALGRYDDVAASFRDYRAFSSEAMHTFFARLRKTPSDPLGRTLVSLDPPRHFPVRRIAASAFAGIRWDSLREFTEQTAHGLLDRALTGGKIDVVAEYATPLALSVISWLLGVDPARAEDFRRWTDDATVNAIRAEAGQTAGVEASHAAMRDYFAGRIEELRERPGEDLLSRLILVEEGGKIDGDELLDLARFLLFAGNKTTRHFVGNAVLALLEYPEARAAAQARLASGESAEGLVDELLRWDTPSQIALRTLTEARHYDETVIPAGSTVFLLSGSANRDPTMFPDPDVLDVARDASAHVGLGAGTHHCLGDRVAKIQSEIALRTLFARAPGLRRADSGPLPYHPLLFLRGLQSLPCVVS